jgi:hypothetical protein
MRPALAFPYHDPQGTMFAHLQAILPDLKAYFERAYICPPRDTRDHVDIMNQLAADEFFMIFPIDKPMQIGDHFAHLYRHAALAAHPDQAIHLCYLDRICFALEGEYRAPFLADVDSLTADDLPLIFQRSARAWGTHPQNYTDIEQFVTRIGRGLFGLDLDYAWCHIVVCAGQLRETMPLVRNRDLSMVAEMILRLQHRIHTRDVDWLAWEDPFILGRDGAELKRERENSLAETEKRLAYAFPMIDALTRFAKNGKK